MAKLHELLAFQSDLNGQATKLRNDLATTFGKKRHLFEETRKTYTPDGEGAVSTVEDQKDIQTTVVSELKWISDHLAKAIDVAYQVDDANTQARADISLEDGTILVKSVPATTLLQLEKRIVEWRDLIAEVPSLDPAKGFKLDESHAKSGVYKARDVIKTRTKKVKEVITLSPATDKFAANVQLLDIDKPAGTVLEQEWSALLLPSTKSELLNNVEILLRAVKSARAKANEQLVDNTKKIGSTLLGFVLKPVLS
jgi:hypothetical protein